MSQTRREFVAASLTVLAGACSSGCSPSTRGGADGSESGLRPPGGPVDVGPASEYAQDGVYAGFRDRGFFLVRRGGQLLAISSICTHRACKINSQKDGSFLCPCHGAKFDAQGHVTHGPARRDLPRLVISEEANGHLLIDSAKPRSPSL